MEHPCPSCGAPVPEGVLFCSQCGTRQAAPSAAPEAPAASASAPPPAPVSPAATVPPAIPPAATKIDWSKAWPGVLIAGGVAGVISSAPVLSLGCCLWVLAAGAVSVLFYRNRAAISVPVGLGARLGAATGAVSSLISSAFTTGSILVMGSGKMRDAMRQGMEQSASSNPDPKAQEMVHRMMEFMTSPGGFAMVITLWFAVTFLAVMAFAAGGGALGASLFGKRESSQ